MKVNSGIESGGYIRENGEEVQIINYSEKGEYRSRVKNILKKLAGEEVDIRDVVFLSPKKYKNSVLKEAGIEVNELGDDYDDMVKLPVYATIQGFKGLDAKVVILTDVDDIREENYSKYLYIAGTRARTLLYIVASDRFLALHERMNGK